MISDEFLDNADKVITDFFKAERPGLLESYGSVQHDVKTDNTVVTKLDKDIEARLRPILKQLDPKIGIEGEEHGIEGSRETYWLVDPIDGTEQFIRGMPTCKNLMTLIDQGEAVWAFMYMFVSDELWLARRGQGVTCNGKKITLVERELRRSWIDLSVQLLDPKVLAAVLRIRPQLAGFTIMRGFDSIIAGKVDGCLCYGSGGGPWDYAPRALFLREAGYKVTNIGKDTYDFRDSNFLAAHPSNFDKLMQLIVDAG